MTDLRQLFLLRHAKSSWDEPALDDFDRPLNKRGRHAAKVMAGYLKAKKLHPAFILCSAARRTRETYDILEPVLEGIPVSFERELYEASKHDLLARLRRLDDHLGSVLLIAHNPGLERLASALSGGHGEAKALARLEEKYPTGTLAMLETKAERWAALEDDNCRLTALVRPADLE